MIEALEALAVRGQGVIVAEAAARALDVPVAEADALLTRLAKTRGDEIDVEVSDRGEVLYVWRRWRPPSPAGRVERRARIAAPNLRVESTSEAEAELEAELDEANAPARRSARR